MGRQHKELSHPSPILTINLEAGMPRVDEALAQLECELASARQQRCSFVKMIHGYGSSGVGGNIRIAVQKRLRELQDQGSIRGCIFGEDWSTSDAQTWSLLQRQPTLKTDQRGQGSFHISRRSPDVCRWAPCRQAHHHQSSARPSRSAGAARQSSHGRHHRARPPSLLCIRACLRIP